MYIDKTGTAVNTPFCHPSKVISICPYCNQRSKSDKPILCPCGGTRPMPMPVVVPLPYNPWPPYNPPPYNPWPYVPIQITWTRTVNDIRYYDDVTYKDAT